MHMPVMAKRLGSGAFKNIIFPIIANITSLDWGASTAASWFGFFDLFRANKKRLVAKTPEKRVTRKVLKICPEDGRGGIITAVSTTQKGIAPHDNNSTL